ncbi:MAG: hypothetical protein JSV33_10540 [bacterium]|nr:MAG: hypothetical protein JSV33_10540 [bacterium]
MINTNDKPERIFTETLAFLVRSRRGYHARGAWAVLFTVGLAIFSLLVALFQAAPGWSPLPLFSFIVFWAGIAAAAVVGGLRHIFPLRSPMWIAGCIGAVSGKGTLFSSALEFSRHGGRLEAYSPYLLSETTRRAGRELRRLLPQRLFGGSGRPGWALAGLLMGVVLLAQISLMDASPATLLTFLSDPSVYFREPRGFNLVVPSGDLDVLAGEDVTVEAVKFGSSQGSVVLRVSTIPDVWKRLPLEPDTVDAGDVPLTVYSHTFSDIQEDLHYYFEAGDERSSARSITVAHRPVINRIGAVLEYPSYTGAAPDTIVTLAGRIVALTGTEVTLTGETSKNLNAGLIDFASGRSMQLAIVPGGFGSRFTVLRNDTFTVSITDSLGLSNDGAVRYPIAALEDRVPIVEVLAPEDEALLPRSLETAILFRASDDYGISRMRLRYMREGKEEDFHTSIMPLPSKGTVREVEGSYRWVLEDIGVFPGDRILYYLEVFDNKTPPGHARTAARRLLVPSLSQIYASIRDEEVLQQDDMEDVLEKGQEIRDRLKSLSDDLKSDGKLDWSRRQAGGEIIEKQRALQDRIGRAAERLDKMLQTLEQNRMTSQDIGEKMEELQRLFRQIENEDLRKAIEKLNRALSQISQQEMLAAMEDMEMNTEELLERLDRTIELLKQLMREEKMEELLRRMEDMLEEQRALKDSTETADSEELSKQQEQLADEYEQFEDDFSDFSDEESGMEASSEMEQCKNRMSDSEIGEMMRKAADELQQGDREQASCTQGGTIDRMLSLYTSLGRCRNAMAAAMEQELIGKLEKAARALIEVSKLEEEFASRVRTDNEPGWRQRLITEQVVLKGAVEAITDDLYEAARMTMSLSAALFMNVGMALGEIEKALSGLEQKNRDVAWVAGRRAYFHINRSVIELLRSSVSSSSRGKNSRRRMQNMLDQQMTIDQRLREMLSRGRREQWSQRQRAEMARIAAEQRSMKELMSQIAKESKGAGELLGRLDDLAGEMEEIAKRLDEGGLDEELLRREERVLSRMLESQRSIHRRDYKRDRVSRTAGDIEALAPEMFEGEIDERELLLRKINRAMQEKGPAEYQELIRQYFRALARKVRERE